MPEVSQSDVNAWVDTRNRATREAAREGGLTEAYERFPAEGKANWPIDLLLKLPMKTQQELFGLAQDIIAEAGVPGIIPQPLGSVHVTVTYGKHLAPTPGPGQPSRGPNYWTRREARAVAAAIAPAFSRAQPFEMQFKDLVLLPKQAFAVPTHESCGQLFALGNSARAAAPGLGLNAYDPAKAPLDGGPIAQANLMIFEAGMDLGAVAEAIEAYRRSGLKAIDIKTLVERAELIVDQHRAIGNPDRKGRVGFFRVSPIATYQLGGAAQIEGLSAEL